MLRVAIGSKNPAKINAVRMAFEMMGMEAEVTGINVESGVPDQPFSDEETVRGAVTRARNVLAQGDFDYGIGLEGGVTETPYGLFMCNWGAVADRDGNVGIGGGHRVQLPSQIAKPLYQGEELGVVMDRLTGASELHKREGAIGVLTQKHIPRHLMFRDVVICAFARFLNPEYYTESHE